MKISVVVVAAGTQRKEILHPEEAGRQGRWTEGDRRRGGGTDKGGETGVAVRDRLLPANVTQDVPQATKFIPQTFLAPGHKRSPS
eukprot:785817-Rhodomonas_salina.2